MTTSIKYKSRIPVKTGEMAAPSCRRRCPRSDRFMSLSPAPLRIPAPAPPLRPSIHPPAANRGQRGGRKQPPSFASVIRARQRAFALILPEQNRGICASARGGAIPAPPPQEEHSAGARVCSSGAPLTTSPHRLWRRPLGPPGRPSCPGRFGTTWSGLISEAFAAIVGLSCPPRPPGRSPPW